MQLYPLCQGGDKVLARRGQIKAANLTSCPQLHELVIVLLDEMHINIMIGHLKGFFKACWTVRVSREHMWECYYVKLCSSNRFQSQVVKALVRNYWHQCISSETSNKNLRDLHIHNNFSSVRLIWKGRKWQSTGQKCGPTQLTGQGWATWCTYSICCSCLVLELQQ